MTSHNFTACNISDLVIGEPLPVSIYLYIDFRFITWRTSGDIINRVLYDRLESKKVQNLFVTKDDHKIFLAWSKKQKEQKEDQISPALQLIREDAHRKVLDVFQSNHPNKIVSQTIHASKELVKEIMKNQYTIKPLNQLQSFSKGTAEHSVNVSILSTYLAMQMGYTHNVILQHVGTGGLLHDIGKSLVKFSDSDSLAVLETKMANHTSLGVELLTSQEGVPAEVKMIVAQHEEFHDGSGGPNKLKGNQIYDLARIVSIANTFDNLVGNYLTGDLIERQKMAIDQIENSLNKRFDPIKLQKAIKILKLGV